MIVAQYDRSAALSAELERIEREHVLDPRLLHAGIFARGYIAFFRADFPTALSMFERLVPAPGEWPTHRSQRVRALG